MKQKTTRKSFTLIEIMLVMVLLGILVIMFVGNFNTTLKRGRDAQRKNDLSQLQKALEVYYEDNGTYPVFASNDIFDKKLCQTTVVSSTTSCPGIQTTYMVKTPKDPSSAAYIYKYVPSVGGQSYYLYSYIENSLDQGSGVKIDGYAGVYCNVGNTLLCRYYVSSSNANPL